MMPRSWTSRSVCALPWRTGWAKLLSILLCDSSPSLSATMIRRVRASCAHRSWPSGQRTNLPRRRRMPSIPSRRANFSIYQGTVVRIPGILGEVRPFLEKQLNARWRTVLGQMWRLCRRPSSPAFQACLALEASSLPLSSTLYVKFMAEHNALIGNDISVLREQIDRTRPDLNLPGPKPSP